MRQPLSSDSGSSKSDSNHSDSGKQSEVKGGSQSSSEPEKVEETIPEITPEENELQIMIASTDRGFQKADKLPLEIVT